MGLTETPYWLSWFSYYVIVITILSFVMMLLMIPVFKNTNLFLLFVYFFLFGMSLFSYSVFITAFFSNGKVASIAGSLIMFFSSFMILIVSDTQSSSVGKHILSIFPLVTIQLGSPIMFAFESQGVGLQFDNCDADYYNFRVSYTYMWLIIDFFVYLILGIYLENVLP